MDPKAKAKKKAPNKLEAKKQKSPRKNQLPGSFYGASDLTRTGELLITSAKICVFICGFMIKKVLQCNDNLKIMFHDIVKH